MPTRKIPLKLSQRLENALIITQITGAMTKIDGWSLDGLVCAPPWLQSLYDRHADAAYREMIEAGFKRAPPPADQ